SGLDVYRAADQLPARGLIQPFPDVLPQQLPRVGLRHEVELAQFLVPDLERRDGALVERTAVEHEHQRVVPRPMRWCPFQEEQATDGSFEAQLLAQFPFTRHARL